MYSFQKSHGFTLVELIVTITILVILGTVAFVSFEKYSSSARDGVRISNAANLYKALSFLNIRNGSFPPPENPSITFTYSGAAIGYQGYAGNNIQSIAKVSNSMDDSITKTPFTYSVNSNKKKGQILGFLEDQSNIALSPSITNEAYAASIPLYPFTIGDSLGVVVSNTGGNLNIPLQISNTGSFEIKITDALVGYSSYQNSKTTLSNQELLSLASTYGSIPRTMQVKLSASDKATNNYFGRSLSISSDGNTAIVGAYFADPMGVTDAGAAYVFVRSGEVWMQQAKLTASDKVASDMFGVSTTISSDGNTIILGANGVDQGSLVDAGAAYVFTRSGGTWTEQQKLTASDKATNDQFGVSTTISPDGSTVVVGAYGADVTGLTDAGAAYVFTRSGGTWIQQAKLTSSDKAANDYFGWSVTLSSDGNTSMIGAYNSNQSGIIDAGAAYVFTRSGGTWTEQQKLTASDKAASNLFGISISLSSDGNTAAIGAYYVDYGVITDAGAAYVFTRSGGTWTEQQKLTASDKATGDFFGYTLAISSNGDTIIVGASRADQGSLVDAGAAYVFTRSGGTWTEQQKLTASDKAASNIFGRPVGISSDGKTVIIGAHATDLEGITDAGALYIFQ